MNPVSKSLSLVIIASLASACASTARVTTTADGAAPRTCMGRTLSSDHGVREMGGCNAVHGDLRITGAVTTLEPLASVRSVSGALAVESAPELDSLDGLEQVHAVSDLVLSHNAELDDLGALGSLKAVRTITVNGNPELKNLRGLEGVRALERLTIEENGIFTLKGLGNLRKVGSFRLERNRRLIDAGALSGVLDVNEVVLVGNPRLAGYFGVLPNLRRRPSFAEMRGNPLSARETAHLTVTPSAGSPSRFSGIDTDRAERRHAQF